MSRPHVSSRPRRSDPRGVRSYRARPQLNRGGGGDEKEDVEFEQLRACRLRVKSVSEDLPVTIKEDKETGEGREFSVRMFKGDSIRLKLKVNSSSWKRVGCFTLDVNGETVEEPVFFDEVEKEDDEDADPSDLSIKVTFDLQPVNLKTLARICEAGNELELAAKAVVEGKPTKKDIDELRDKTSDWNSVLSAL